MEKQINGINKVAGQTAEQEAAAPKGAEFTAVLKKGSFEIKGRKWNHCIDIKLTDTYYKKEGLQDDEAGLLYQQGKHLITGKLNSGTKKDGTGNWVAIDYLLHEKLRKRVFLSDAEILMVTPEQVVMSEVQ